MKVQDLQGKYYTLNVGPYTKITNRPRSMPHMDARRMIKEVFPYDIVAEEVLIPGENLYIDFLIPFRKICIEVQGEQHRSFSLHYHGDIAGFKAAQARDRRKAEWCELNGFTLITLDDNEKKEIWEQKLRKK